MIASINGLTFKSQYRNYVSINLLSLNDNTNVTWLCRRTIIYRYIQFVKNGKMGGKWGRGENGVEIPPAL
jgi:hypothetical protein